MRKEGTIILLDEIRRKKKAECRGVTPEDITELLKEAARIGKNTPTLKDDELAIFTEESARLFFSSCIIDALKKKKTVNSTLFHCTSYIAKLLVQLFSSTPRYLVAFKFMEDHTESHNPYILQRGGDTCFLVSSLFTGRGNWRAMKAEYYRDMGMQFYHSFYCQTLRPIGFYMGKNFTLMARVTNDCMNALHIDTKIPR